jgi:two-component system, chemotaxis family, chemotaxis protein CheY
VREPGINLTGLSFLIADPSQFSCSIAIGILRGFGASRVLDVRSVPDAVNLLAVHNVDMLLIDPRLPPSGGLRLLRAIRRNGNNPSSMVPTIVMTGDTRISVVKEARDSGANMILAKPMSPTSLYKRLCWMAFNPHKFVTFGANSYFGHSNATEKFQETAGWPHESE